MTTEPPKLGDTLTLHEKAVCDMMAEGLTSKEIGRALGKSFHTIHMYRKNILRKTGARNLADVVRIVVETKMKGPKS